MFCLVFACLLVVLAKMAQRAWISSASRYFSKVVGSAPSPDWAMIPNTDIFLLSPAAKELVGFQVTKTEWSYITQDEYSTGGSAVFITNVPVLSLNVYIRYQYGVMWCGVVWCGVVWCGVVWCGVVWCGVVWCGVVWCGVVWCGVVWCGVVWCGVVWCGVVWCGVVWCGVVWCGVVRCGAVRCGAVRCGAVRCGAVRCGAVRCGAVRCGAVWCGVVWCGVVWCGVVWCGVVWCGVVWCGVVWCGVVRCGVVWCGVVWCGVVWCGAVCRRLCYRMAMAGMVLHTGNAKREDCVSKRTRCVWYVVHLWQRAITLSLVPGVCCLGCPGAALPLCLMVLLKFSLDPGLCAPGPWSSFDGAGTRLRSFSRAVGSGDPFVYRHTAVGSGQWFET